MAALNGLLSADNLVAMDSGRTVYQLGQLGGAGWMGEGFFGGAGVRDARRTGKEGRGVAANMEGPREGSGKRGEGAREGG